MSVKMEKGYQFMNENKIKPLGLLPIKNRVQSHYGKLKYKVVEIHTFRGVCLWLNG